MATNTLSVYDPLFYAQEALKGLKKSLGIAPRIHRGYDKNPQQPGSIISIRIPTEFSAGDAPVAASNIVASELQISLDYWREVKFELTDKELTVSRQEIIEEHIEPAAYALADDIDTKLATMMYQQCPWEEAAAAPSDVSDIVNCRGILFGNKVPMGDGMRHFMVDGTIGGELLQNSAFTQWQGAGSTGEAAQISGNLGTRFGFSFFENQNVQTHTAGALTIGTQLQLNADITAGATSTVFKDSGGSLTGTVAVGDTFVIAGNSQRYAITAAATASSNLVSIAFTPKAVTGYSASDNVTASQNTGAQCLAFHKNIAALAMAPLSTLGREVSGARMETVVDPVTRLALRSRMFYDGTNSKVIVALDVLYGIKMLRNNFGVRLWNA